MKALLHRIFPHLIGFAAALCAVGMCILLWCAPAWDGTYRRGAHPGTLPKEKLPILPRSDEESPSALREEAEATLLGTLMRQGRLIESREKHEGGEALLVRSYLIEAKIKYPLVQVDQTFRMDLQNGQRLIHESAYVADHFAVKLVPGTDERELEQLNSRYRTRTKRTLRAGNTFLVEVAAPSLDAVKTAITYYKQNISLIQTAEPDFIVTLSQEAPSNDPRLGELWGLRNYGQVADSTIGADSGATHVWSRSTGSKDILVGVIDTGIDYNHQDLAPNVWRNPGEIQNGIDDDGNGFIDDLRGWNFAGDNNNPADDNQHGTHVAGTIGAVANNALGVAGVAPSVSLVALKIFNASGFALSSDAADAIAYANRMGIPITSNSWGGNDYSQILKDEIDRADQKGFLFVAAAGNNADNVDVHGAFPAAYNSPNIISVAAVDAYDGLASFSNYGVSAVDLAAPGVLILSTLPGNAYGNLSGTSMATPHVSGALVLLRSLLPGRSHHEYKRLLLDGAVRIPALEGKVKSGGRLNVARALQIADMPLIDSALVVTDSPPNGLIGNGDGSANPGETIRLDLSLRNTTTLQYQGVHAHLLLASPMEGIEIVGNESSFGTIQPGATAVAANGFLVKLAPTLSAPVQVHLTAVVSDEELQMNSVPLTFWVTEAAGIRGQVTLDGAPFEGATVMVNGPLSLARITDAGGRYNFSGLNGRYSMSVKTGSLGSTLPVRATIPLATESIDFTLVTAMSGTITDSYTDAPIAGALVEMRDFAGQTIEYQKTDSSGRYRLVVDRETVTTFFSLNVKKPGFYFSAEKRIFASDYGRVTDMALVPGNLSISPIKEFSVFTAPTVKQMNSAGDMVGELRIIGADGASSDRAFLLKQNGILVDIASSLESLYNEKSIYSSAFDINENGTIVGAYRRAATAGAQANRQLPYVWRNGAATLLPLLNGAIQGQATAINNRDEIVGIAFDSAGRGRAVQWKNTGGAYQAIDLGTLGWEISGARDINDNGVVVGYSYPSPFEQRAFIHEGGVMRDLGMYSGGSYSIAYRINNFGQVLGAGDRGSQQEIGLIWQSEGQILPLAMPPAGIIARPSGLKEGTNEAVGSLRYRTFVQKGILWRDGIPIELENLLAVNDGGRLQNFNSVIEIFDAPAIAADGTIATVYFDFDRGAYVIGRVTVRSRPRPMPTATATPQVTPSPMPTHVAPIKGDLDGDLSTERGLEILHPRKGKIIRRYRLFGASSALSISKRRESPGLLPVHGRYVPSESWQLAYLSHSPRNKLLWNIKDSREKRTRRVVFGRMGDIVMSGCFLSGGDSLSEMAVLRGRSKLIVRDSATGAISASVLALPRGMRIKDMYCADMDGDSADEIFVLARIPGSKAEPDALLAFSPMGTLRAEVPLREKAGRILIGDFNMDTKTDLVTSYRGVLSAYSDIVGSAEWTPLRSLPRLLDLAVVRSIDAKSAVIDRLVGLTRNGRLLMIEWHAGAQIVEDVPARRRGEVTGLIKSVNVHITRRPK